MKDRVPTYPGRVRLTPVSGQTNVYTLERADVPTQEGTPLNKANLLSDTTANLLIPSEGDPTPDKAFRRLSEDAHVIKGNGAPNTSTVGRIGDIYIDVSVSDPISYICTNATSSGYQWDLLAVLRRTLHTDIITSSQIWPRPANLTAEDDVFIRVFGGGGGGGYGSSGSGGGGGYMATWTGHLTESSYTVTIGSGGTGGYNQTYHHDGTSGGTTSFGTLVSAAGGGGGGTYAGNGGSGGGARAGNIAGGSGSYGGGGGGGLQDN